MNGEIAQLIALTCYANAFLSGQVIPIFFPHNSTVQFVDSIKFVKRLPEQKENVVLATNTDDWFDMLKQQKSIGVRLVQRGSAYSLYLEVLFANNSSDFYLSKWSPNKAENVEKRIWKVTYFCVAQSKTELTIDKSLSVIKTNFEKTLLEIRTFARQNNLKNWAGIFDKALYLLVSTEPPRCFYNYFNKDMVIPDAISSEALALLKAANQAWVFGGMGSWNDIGCDYQAGYHKVSKNLLNMLYEVIAAAASSTFRV